MKAIRFLSFIVVAAACGDDDGSPAGADGPAPGVDGSTGSDGPPAQQGWQALAPLPRGPRQETAVVAVGARIYVIGGLAGAGVSAAVEVYDTGTGVWSDGPDLPTAMHHCNAAVVGTTIVVAGGMTGLAPFVANGSVVRWDTAGSGGWTAGAAMPGGSERGASGAGAIDGFVYVVAGSRGSSVADFSRYDLSGDAWEPLAALPAPRNHLAAGVVDGSFYAVGGRDPGQGDVKPEVWRWDDGAWTPRAPMLTARGGAAAAVLGGRIYVMGGEGSPDQPGGVFAENESYDPVGDAWMAHEPMRTPRHGTGAATVGGTIYVPGGADVEGFGFVDTVESFTP